MRKLLLLALAAPLFVACETGGGTGVPPLTESAGNPDRALRNAQPGSGQNAAGGTARIVGGQMGEGGPPQIERGPAPAGAGVGCPPGTRPVVVQSTQSGESGARTVCQ